MSSTTHSSAKPSHYNKDAEQYDAFNEKNSEVINHTVETILKKHRVTTVLDLACGTGSQVFWLIKRGYKVVGSDINPKMLAIAKAKAKKAKVKIPFLKGDMRTLQPGTFDAVITIFNAIGHLTKADFEKAVQNIHNNLTPGGLYVFDIFNQNYVLKDDNITTFTIDWQKKTGSTTVRYIQYSTIDREGIMASYTTSITRENSQTAKVTKAVQTLQIYTSHQLKEMLHRNGFKVVRQCAIDGSKFLQSKSDRIVTIAQKRL